MIGQKTVIDLGGGMKGINFEPWGGIEGFLAATSNGRASTTPQQLRAVVPWLAKADDMTALAVSELPFDIVKDDDSVYDTSTAWKDNLGGIPSPEKLLYKLASSLCQGRAYLIPTVTSRALISLQYCTPDSIQPQIDSEGLHSFDRATGQGKSGRYYPAQKEIQSGYMGEMMYFWLPDSDVEVGPALTYPASTALLSAELMILMDSTIRTYADRGFVPATILAAKGMSNAQERDKAETWWNRFLRGWDKTTAKIVNSEAVTISKVGAGLDELRGVYGELTKQAIENIGTSYGIPAALFMSDMAFASEVNPLIKVWYTTSVFIKIYHTIEDTFNTQLLSRFGLKMKFKPETIDAFQEDEVQRAGSFKVYCDAGIKKSIAAEMVGLELPAGITYADLDPVTPPALVPFAGQTPLVNTVVPPNQTLPVQQPATPILNAAQIKDLDLWRQMAIRFFKKGKSPAIDFECKALTDEMAETIRERLKTATSEADILSAFEIKTAQPELIDIAVELKRANDWLEAHV